MLLGHNIACNHLSNRPESHLVHVMTFNNRVLHMRVGQRNTGQQQLAPSWQAEHQAATSQLIKSQQLYTSCTAGVAARAAASLGSVQHQQGEQATLQRSGGGGCNNRSSVCIDDK